MEEVAWRGKIPKTSIIIGIWIVDSAEQPVQRPVDYQEKKYYSGKKKMHTFKNQFIVLPNGEDIVDVIVGKLGKTSDINLFRLAVISWTPNKGFRW